MGLSLPPAAPAASEGAKARTASLVNFSLALISFMTLTKWLEAAWNLAKSD
jgi:hypothetical protein